MKGHLEVIAGPMFSGKTEETIRRLRRAEIAGEKTIIFKPAIDNRYDENDVVSHSGLWAKAYPIIDSNFIKEKMWDGPFDVVAIDEAQFFDDNLPEVINILIEFGGLRVIAAGLDMDFRKEPFGVMPNLMARAKYIIKLRAVCQKCKSDDAMYTQRLLNGQPAPLDGNIVEVGGQDQYEARCSSCWEAG